MNIREHVSLARYTTFKIGGAARFYCSVKNEDELVRACQFAKEKNLAVFILGGGSNVLISDKGFDGLVIRIRLKGINSEDIEVEGAEPGGSKSDNSLQSRVLVTAAAGEQWDDLVDYSVSHGLYGIENLSAIPGTVGAAPVQNIGAYGSEIAETLIGVRALNTETMTFVQLSNEDCHFTYRDSIFKKEKGRYIITNIKLSLLRNGKINIGYKDLKEYFEKNRKTSPTLAEVRDAVINIRWAKLPDWKLWGTAGSFFKNPIIPASQFSVLKAQYPELPGFPESGGRVKVSLGWILDKICNVKDMQKGNVRAYEKQALVLVAKPGATSEEVVALANELMRLVKEKTGIVIEGEVEWVN
jgi:UDP-N-acetylmuramate dehydrogenase